ncbi:MAG TPA: efflux RND transporter periplasmic adaptor subunit, partial [Gammaproteobacteria bacterium]|nr:efflux RND transporter periplasmic adaptor subunit [Gammaproteobacteria bacterium]
MKRLTIIAVLAIVVLAGVWYFARPKPIKVAVIEAARGPVSATVANTRAGTVDACRRARLAPASGGQIAMLPVKKGEHVKQNQLLLELWNEDTKAQLELQRRDAVATRSQAREACVTADVAKRDAERTSKLHDQKLASEEAADQARGKAESSAAGCKAAEDTVRVAEARIDVTKAQLERTQLYAPFDGVIAEINGELGEFVTPSPVGIPTPPTIDLIDATCLYISAPIDEVDAP